MVVQAKGNAAFSSGNFEEAITHYTAGIDVDETNHVLFSNRSACEVLFIRFLCCLELQLAFEHCCQAASNMERLRINYPATAP